jgi:acetylglutamate kinase
MTSQTDEWMEKAGVLIEALPYMRRYGNKPIVVKFGGHAMGEQAYVDSFAADMTLLRQIGAQPVVVHGGGPQIGDMLKRVEMVLAGAINKSLVAAVNMAGGRAVGLSGKDGHLITASKLSSGSAHSDSQIEKVDLGFVGKPETVDPKVITALMAADMIPVIAPIGSGTDGQTYNINADTAAGAVAGAIGASRLLMLTDVAGVRDKNGDHISRLKLGEARALIKDGTVQGGMIPKVETCIEAVEKGAEAAVILDGRAPHAVLVELFTEHGIGTLITRD